jgi:4-diphosphocytidyl-2-C-methyl-D-erythritol kinase
MILLEPAPFKLNLSLRVVGKRADGYHLLETLFAFVDSGDELTWQAGGRLQLSISGRFANAAPADETNLVLRAARLLDPQSKHGGRLHLTKNVPSGAGLGGGSADAAAALRLLNRAWGLGHDLDTLAGLALQLGADVPACVYSKPAWARGVGEELTFIATTQMLPVLVICPPVEVSTAAAFAALQGPYSAQFVPWPPETLAFLSDGVDKAAWKNDLCSAAILCAPQLAKVQIELKRIAQQHEGVIGYGMSGSGSSHFIVTNNMKSLKTLESLWLIAYPAEILLRKWLILPTVI